MGGCYIASQRSDGVELITGDIITNDIITVLYLIAHKIVRLGVLGLINLIYATVSVKVIDIMLIYNYKLKALFIVLSLLL